jgi:hypothetical protein
MLLGCCLDHSERAMRLARVSASSGACPWGSLTARLSGRIIFHQASASSDRIEVCSTIALSLQISGPSVGAIVRSIATRATESHGGSFLDIVLRANRSRHWFCAAQLWCEGYGTGKPWNIQGVTPTPVN